MTLEQLRAILYLWGVTYRACTEDVLAWDVPVPLPPEVRRAVGRHWDELVREAARRPDLTVRGMHLASRFEAWPC